MVRGGLTRKHVAIDELRRVLSVGAVKPAVIEPIADATGELRWPAPRPEFALSQLQVNASPRDIAVTGPQILLCLEGKVDVSAADTAVPLRSGESAFVTADTGAFAISGDGLVMRASAGIFPT